MQKEDRFIRFVDLFWLGFVGLLFAERVTVSVLLINGNIGEIN